MADRGGRPRLEGPRAAERFRRHRPGARRRHVEVFQGHARSPRRPNPRGVSSTSTIPTWLSGPAAIGYGETFIATNLTDMRGSYTSVYLRKTFDVVNLAALDKLILEVKYDDGVNLWINGKLGLSGQCRGREPALHRPRHGRH